jgi:hypothetical protein
VSLGPEYLTVNMKKMEEGGIWFPDIKKMEKRGMFFFTMGGVYFPEHDIIMEDSAEARKLAQEMKLERKRKAYEETN